MSDLDELEEQPVPPVLMVAAEVALITKATAAAIGTTPKAIRRRIENRVWAEGREYHRRDGRIWIDFKGIAKWVRGDAEAA